jgi:predicted DNA-binding transcriptional regulator YafY
VPVEGEAGVGYRLGAGFDLPPIMFTVEEVEALVAGARIVEAWGGPALARQVRSATWSPAAWCESREDFRNFRLDRISSLDVLAEKFEDTPGRTLEDFVKNAR